MTTLKFNLKFILQIENDKQYYCIHKFENFNDKEKKHKNCLFLSLKEKYRYKLPSISYFYSENNKERIIFNIKLKLSLLDWKHW